MGFLLQRTPIGFSDRLSFPPARGYSASALIPLRLHAIQAYEDGSCCDSLIRLMGCGDITIRKGFINTVKEGSFPVKNAQSPAQYVNLPNS
jgi:hypothetical protein